MDKNDITKSLQVPSVNTKHITLTPRNITALKHATTKNKRTRNKRCVSAVILLGFSMHQLAHEEVLKLHWRERIGPEMSCSSTGLITDCKFSSCGHRQVSKQPTDDVTFAPNIKPVSFQSFSACFEFMVGFRRTLFISRVLDVCRHKWQNACRENHIYNTPSSPEVRNCYTINPERPLICGSSGQLNFGLRSGKFVDPDAGFATCPIADTCKQWDIGTGSEDTQYFHSSPLNDE